MEIRKADEAKDFEKIWEIFSNVIQTGDTYVFDANTPVAALHQLWFADYMDTFVAVDADNTISGTYIIKPNQVDLGNHIANCSYMVNPWYQGKGIGSMLCEHSIMVAKQKGYLGIQFNIVVSSNTRAVRLWKKFGFQVIGTNQRDSGIRN